MRGMTLPLATAAALHEAIEAMHLPSARQALADLGAQAPAVLNHLSDDKTYVPPLTQAARRGLLQVPDDAVTGIRSSTEAWALVKARAIRERLGATWGLSETGASGPTGNRYGDAAGHACFAIAGSHHSFRW